MPFLSPRACSFAAPVALVALVACLPACGGATPPPSGAPCPTAAPAAEAPKSDPPPFTGTFEVVRGGDGKGTVVDFSKMFKQGGHDGKMLWTLEPDGFSVSVWTLGSYAAPETPDQELYSLCRGNTRVKARYEGASVVLPGGLAVQGYSAAVFMDRKREKGSVTTRTLTKNNDCSANMDAKRITFEVVEKDAEGPVKLKATAEAATPGEESGIFELVRSTPVDKLDVKMLVQKASMR